MSKTFGLGLIGTGGMGMAIVNRVLERDSRITVRAVFDPDDRSVASALEDIAGRAPGAPANPMVKPPEVCGSYEAVMARDDVDWVMIASWNRFHCEQVVRSFQEGKHVFCQKPLALSVDECLRMRDAWKESGCMFNLGFTLRYSPHYRKIWELVHSGSIGEVVSLEFNETLEFNHGGYIMGDWRRLRENAGTHMLEKCCHDIDLVNWIVGARASRVASFGGLSFFVPENRHHVNRIGPSPDGKKAYQTWRALVGKDPFQSDKDIFDNQVVIIEYRNGVRATFHTNANAGLPERRMYILGTEGAIRADVLTGSIELKRIGWATPKDDLSTGAKGGHGNGDDVLADELVTSMTTGSGPTVGLSDGIDSTVTVLAIDEAADTGHVVDLSPYWTRVDA